MVPLSSREKEDRGTLIFNPFYPQISGKIVEYNNNNEASPISFKFSYLRLLASS